MDIRKLASEFVGSAILVAVVVGSGIMATNLSKDVGVQLLINTFSTIFVLYILIELFAPIGGAHFNPAVSIVSFALKKLSLSELAGYVVFQFAGAALGTVLANLMFKHKAIELSTHIRGGGAILLGEVIATAGLVYIIFSAIAQKKDAKIPMLVSLWIGSAYLFTSSTSFANPAVTFARSLSESFAGIAGDSVPLFVCAQLIGAAIGVVSAIYFQPELRKVKQ